MPTIKEFKEDLQFNAGLIELLDIMKNTAVFQFRALQAKKKRFDLFFNTVENFFSIIGKEDRGNIFITPASKRKAVIVITSDDGFVGGLNAQVVNKASLDEGFREAEIAVIGERGVRYLKETRKNFTSFKGAATQKERYALAGAVKDYIFKGVKEERFGSVDVIYPKSVSFMYQKAEAVKILPLSLDLEAEAVEAPKDKRPLIVESPIDGIVKYLAEELIKERLVDILEDSKLSEFAARAIHLEGSAQELTETNKKVKPKYFKAYHEIIDKNTRELFAAKVTIHKKRLVVKGTA